MKKILALFLVIGAVSLSLAGCSGAPKNLKDGIYTAEFSDARAEASHGWKDKLVIKVTNGAAVIVEFESYNTEDNRAKSTDDTYPMTVEKDQTTPSLYFPQLVENWYAAEGNPSKIEVVAGATDSTNSLKELMKAALEASQNGDTSIITVE